jgi:ACS family tartrate transporter-like MFS transporter
MINSIGNLGGFVGPYAVGLIRDMTGSFSGGIMFLVLSLLSAAVLLMAIRKEGRGSPAVEVRLYSNSLSN